MVGDSDGLSVGLEVGSCDGADVGLPPNESEILALLSHCPVQRKLFATSVLVSVSLQGYDGCNLQTTPQSEVSQNNCVASHAVSSLHTSLTIVAPLPSITASLHDDLALQYILHSLFSRHLNSDCRHPFPSSSLHRKIQSSSSWQAHVLSWPQLDIVSE